MQVNSAINSAMLGYQHSIETLDDAAQTLTQQASNVSPVSPTLAENSALISPVPAADSINSALLNMHTAMYNGLAALQVIRTADDMLGTSIDVTI